MINVNECNGYIYARIFLLCIISSNTELHSAVHIRACEGQKTVTKLLTDPLVFMRYYTGRPGRCRGWGGPFRRATQNTADRPGGEGVRRPVLSRLVNYEDAADLLAPEIWIKEMARNGYHETGASNCERNCPYSVGVCSPNLALH